MLDYDQLVTTLLEAEAMVNSRPLIHVPVDEENLDYMVLTPSHFVHRARPVAMPVPDDVEYDEDFVMSLSKTEEVLAKWTIRCNSSTCQGTNRYITRGGHCGNHQG